MLRSTIVYVSDWTDNVFSQSFASNLLNVFVSKETWVYMK